MSSSRMLWKKPVFLQTKTKVFLCFMQVQRRFFKSCSLFGIPVIVSSRTAFINVLNCGTNLGREPRMKDCVSLYLCKCRSYMSEKIQQLCQQLNNIYTYLNDQFQYCRCVFLSYFLHSILINSIPRKKFGFSLLSTLLHGGRNEIEKTEDVVYLFRLQYPLKVAASHKL